MLFFVGCSRVVNVGGNLQNSSFFGPNMQVSVHICAFLVSCLSYRCTFVVMGKNITKAYYFQVTISRKRMSKAHAMSEFSYKYSFIDIVFVFTLIYRFTYC